MLIFGAGPDLDAGFCRLKKTLLYEKKYMCCGSHSGASAPEIAAIFCSPPPPPDPSGPAIPRISNQSARFPAGQTARFRQVNFQHLAPILAACVTTGGIVFQIGKQSERLEIIGLKVEAQEKNVGKFRADILCKDINTDNWVLIENQLEKTNHGHLGQT